MLCEWLANHLGRELGLPIPDFTQVEVPSELIQYSARSDAGDLGAGIGFGSVVVDQVDELTFSAIDRIDVDLRAKILLFDWWVCNGDRTLSQFGGNPNLLWSHQRQELHVIDHNLAFDEGELDVFWNHHIFASSHTGWNSGFRVQMELRMRAALGSLQQRWNEMPEEWTEFETGLTLDWLTGFLWRFEKNPSTFWERK